MSKTHPDEGVKGAFSWGTDPAIQTIHPERVEIKYKAKFHGCKCCCFKCDFSACCCGFCSNLDRKYYYIMENALQTNTPFHCCYCIDCCGCCTDIDCVSMSYFDRGVFNRQVLEHYYYCTTALPINSRLGCCWWSRCLNGPPTMYVNNYEYYCCWIPCCELGNNCLSCHFPSVCGDRVSFSPCERCCCCLETRVSSHCLCLGNFCGPKVGSPGYLCPVASCLAIGSGQEFASALQSARDDWSRRVGKD